jgi:hypothetical protein
VALAAAAASGNPAFTRDIQALATRRLDAAHINAAHAAAAIMAMNNVYYRFLHVRDQWLRQLCCLARAATAPARFEREAVQSAVCIAATVHAVARALGATAGEELSAAAA